MTTIYLLCDAGRIHVTPPTASESSAACDCDCPDCGASPLRVQGTGRRVSADDRAYEADGYCAACRAHVGTIRAEVSTLFGIHEDEAVLYGRPRVY